MKTKVNFKILVALGIMLLAVLAFNTNTVNATGTSNVIIPNPIAENLIDDIYANSGSSNMEIYFEIDVFKAYEVMANTNKLDTLVKNDNYVYQTIYIEIADNIDEVLLNDTTLNIENLNGKKYATYDIRIFQKEGNTYKLVCMNDFDEILTGAKLVYKENSKPISNYNLSVSAYRSGVPAYIEIVDKDNNNINGSEHILYLEGDSYGASSVEFETKYDYSEAYYVLYLTKDMGESVKVKDLGNFAFDGIVNYEDFYDFKYSYKMKIQDTSVFGTAQSLTYILQVKNTLGNWIDIFPIDISIVGETRQTYTVNDETKNIGISLNGATTTGVSLEAKTINENDKTFIEMTNSIAEYKNFLSIGAYDIKLVGGDYDGDLNITFTLGKENEGKKVHIWHKKADGNYEHFVQVVENGKVVIKVTELSPFFLAYEKTVDETTNTGNTTTTTPNGEKDETPKTGTVDIIGYVSIVAIISAVGIIAFRKKEIK